MKRYLLAILVLAIAVPAVIAATATQRVDVQGLRVPLHVTVDGTSVAVDGIDTTGGSKRSLVVAAVVSGQAVKALLRIQLAPNGLFVDQVFSNTLENLETAAGAMDLSATVSGHPSPTDDAFDAEAIAAAGE